MTYTFLSVLPTYGLWIVHMSVILSCIAVPVPSSVMVIAAGGAAATGDFRYSHLAAFALAGCLMDDQFTFLMARRVGVPLINRLASKPKTENTIERAKDLVEHRETIANVLSRTILSPLGPYVSCLAGTLGMSWLNLELPASTGPSFGASVIQNSDLCWQIRLAKSHSLQADKSGLWWLVLAYVQYVQTSKICCRRSFSVIV